jgi:hypothetical protein
MRCGAGDARIWTAAILIAAWIAVVWLNWPGQLSYDSVLQLSDGRAGYYHSWHPAIMAWLLGLFDAVMPGTGLFVVFNSALLFGALMAIAWMRPRSSWMAPVLAALVVPLPQLILYPGIVWKDVLFADAAVAGFACLAWVETRWSEMRRRSALLALAFALLILASLTRQNGILVLVAAWLAVVLLAWQAGGARSAVLHGAATSAGAAMLLLLLGHVLDTRSDHGEGPVAQWKLLQIYDLSGAVAAEPSLPLEEFRRSDPRLGQLVRADGARLYSPERNDTLAGSPLLFDALARAAPDVVGAQWMDLVLRHTGLYLRVRLAAFGQVFLTPDIAACRPVFTGIEGPMTVLSRLRIEARRDARDLRLAAYAKSFMTTPVFSHVAYAILSLAILALLMRRRAPGDIAMAAMLCASLLFTASFFAISIACDYRYLYFLDLASLTAVFYVALAPYGFHVKAMRSGSFWLFRSAARKS